MKPVRTLVVDDEEVARSGLRQMLSAEPDLEVVGEAANGPEALSLLREHPVDLLFLDIQMPVMTGFQLLDRLEPGPAPVVVFLTAYTDFAIQAFDARALDYLLKPVSELRLAQAVARAREAVRHIRIENDLDLSSSRDDTTTNGRDGATAHPSRFQIRTGNRTYYVDVRDIDYIDAQDYYARLWINGRSHLLRESLQHLEQRLDKAFVRVHRSAIVHLPRVREIVSAGGGQYAIVLQNGARLRLARDRKAMVHAALLSYTR